MRARPVPRIRLPQSDPSYNICFIIAPMIQTYRNRLAQLKNSEPAFQLLLHSMGYIGRLAISPATISSIGVSKVIRMKANTE